MSTDHKIPPILVISSLNPIEQEGKLKSPLLHDRVLEYEQFLPDMQRELLEARPGSLEELSKARAITDLNLLKIADKLQEDPKNPKLWVDRFNQINNQIYGPIDLGEVAKIAALELRELHNSGDQLVIDTYKKLSQGKGVEVQRKQEFELLNSFKKVVLVRFGNVISIIDALPEGPYTSEAVRKLFSKVLKVLAEKDKDWQEWKITNTPGSKVFKVIKEKKAIDIPDNRLPVEARSDLLKSVVHEVGVHAQRVVNGHKTGDKMMSNGLPYFIGFEEGLAIFFEYLLTGVTPDRIRDRYIGTALALGAVDGYFVTREELIDFSIRRDKARSIIRGKTIDEKLAMQSAKNDVNRIFRGSNGIPVRGKDGKIVAQAVFSKDIVYYAGFIKAKDYILKQLERGVEPGRLFDFLLTAKFDPTNPLHIEYLRSVHSLEL